MKLLQYVIWLSVLFTLYNSKVYGVREDGLQLIEAHVSFYCYRLNPDKNAEILILKRQNNRKIAPGEWECGGGQVRINESFETAVQRQLYEETGLSASHWRPMGCFEMKVDDKIVPGISFSCRVDYTNNVKLDNREHNEYRWVSLDEIKDLEFVSPKMKQTIIRLLISQSRAW